MTSSMEDFTKKLDGVELMVSQLETWRSSADEATDRLLSQAETVISRLQRLEAAPPPPPPPPVPPRPSTAPPHPLPRRPDLLDLNLAPHQETRPPATSWERPSGHRVATNHRDGGGGILGSQPPHPVTGLFGWGASEDPVRGSEFLGRSSFMAADG
ncbi:hypothetical protein PVAP13_5NG062500 [Panicum virgatum]|uniref:Uncharacterized protein n=1 Tax=Panicum virgatum TaxID=38727 RepID=A0A8T0RP02_PANVG|nr:hypothetical protein PVAP13_5NG062500 [Panicum virgatum]